jgi:peptide/nickel transport system permease protein
MAVAVPAPPDASAIVRRRGQFIRSMPIKAKVGATILGVFVLVAIIGPAIAPFDPTATSGLQNVALSPTWHHLFGTTDEGQDVLSEMLVGMRATVVLGFVTATIVALVAVAVGVTAGFLGGAADEGLSLLMNVFIVLPALPLLIIALGYLPHSGTLATAIVLSVLGWAWGARVIRAQTLTLRSRDFVAAARETGERSWRIVVFEIIPNEVSLIAAIFVGAFLYAILTSVALAFIGVTDVNQWSLGVILYWAQGANAFNVGAWWWYLPPGLAAALLGMGLVLLNFGLDELGNPRLRDTSGRRRRGERPWRPTDPTPVERVEAAT